MEGLGEIISGEGGGEGAGRELGGDAEGRDAIVNTKVDL